MNTLFQKLACTEQDVIAALEVQDPSNQYRIAYNLIVDSKNSSHMMGEFFIDYSASFHKGPRLPYCGLFDMHGELLKMLSDNKL